MEKCKICDKESKFCGLVWFSSKMEETYLCRSHYMKFCKSKEFKLSKEKYKDAKPCTKKWKQMCDEQSAIYLKWEATSFHGKVKA